MDNKIFLRKNYLKDDIDQDNDYGEAFCNYTRLNNFPTPDTFLNYRKESFQFDREIESVMKYKDSEADIQLPTEMNTCSNSYSNSLYNLGFTDNEKFNPLNTIENNTLNLTEEDMVNNKSKNKKKSKKKKQIFNLVNSSDEIKKNLSNSDVVSLTAEIDVGNEEIPNPTYTLLEMKIEKLKFLEKKRAKEISEKNISDERSSLHNMILKTKEEIKCEKNRLAAKRSREQVKKRIKDLENFNSQLLKENSRLFENNERNEKFIERIQLFLNQKLCQGCKKQCKSSGFSICLNGENCSTSSESNSTEYTNTSTINISSSSNNSFQSPFAKYSIFAGVLFVVCMLGNIYQTSKLKDLSTSSSVTLPSEKNEKRMLMYNPDGGNFYTTYNLSNHLIADDARSKAINQVISSNIEKMDKNKVIFSTYKDVRNNNTSIDEIKYKETLKIKLEEFVSRLTEKDTPKVNDVLTVKVNNNVVNENKGTSITKYIPLSDSCLTDKVYQLPDAKKKNLSKSNQIVPFYDSIAVKNEINKKFSSLYILNYVQNDNLFEYLRSIKIEQEVDSMKLSSVKDCRYLYLIIENPNNREEAYEIGLKVIDLVPHMKH